MISDKELTETQKELLIYFMSEVEKKAMATVLSDETTDGERTKIEIAKNIIAKIIWLS